MSETRRWRDPVSLDPHPAAYTGVRVVDEILARRGLITAEWGTSENNRKARFYRLTSAGRRQLAHETSRWERLIAAVGRVLQAEPEKV